MSGTISLLLNSGMDTFTNLFDINITFPTAIYPQSNVLITDAPSVFSVRASGFQPPELTLQTSQVTYKAIQLERLTPKITGERTFTIDFRVDSSYEVYKLLMAWKHIWVDPTNEGDLIAGAYGDSALKVTDDKTNYGSIEVVAYKANTPLSGFSDSSQNTMAPSTDNNSIVVNKWSFYDVICSKVGTPNFQRTGSDFVTISSEFIFGRLVEPTSQLDISGTATAVTDQPVLS